MWQKIDGKGAGGGAAATPIVRNLTFEGNLHGWQRP